MRKSAEVFTVTPVTALQWRPVSTRGPCGEDVNTHSLSLSSSLLSTGTQAAITHFKLGARVTALSGRQSVTFL